MGEIKIKRFIKDPKDALQMYTWIVKEDPTDVIALFHLGTLYLKSFISIGPKAKRKAFMACNKFQKATRIKPSFPEAFNNWGVVLSSLAELGGRNSTKLSLQATKKFLKAIEHKPNYRDAFNNLKKLLNWCNRENNKSKRCHFKISEEISIGYNRLTLTSGAFDLGCIFAIGADEKRCRYWLKIGEKAKTLPTRKKAISDKNLVFVRDKKWFKAIHWKGE